MREYFSKAEWYVAAGEEHKSRGEQCQDSVVHLKEGSLDFYGVADGQSGKMYSHIGGKEVMKSIFEYIREKTLETIITHPYRDEIRYELARTIRERLTELSAQHEADAGEFSSTLVIFVMDLLEGTYLTIHLGDGGILVKRRDGKIGMISKPENGLTRQYTWLTTSNDLIDHLRLKTGRIDDYERVLLFSDGASPLCCGSNIQGHAMQLLTENVCPDEVFSYMESCGHSDDASCIIVDINQTA
ncbi:MAG: protein phosphatase 2C domain-containing protein [Lachnospiraceae bacterium]|nr:protein phosphatase 2C domain-containing protein [Lachnospiraceae bacterium]